MGSRYYVALLVDAAGAVVQRLGSSVSGPGGTDHLFVGPAGGAVPDGMRRIDVSGNDMWLLMRVATDGTAADEKEAARLLRGFRLAPLANPALLDRPQEEPPVERQPLRAPSAPMGSLAFFHTLADMLRRNPVPAEDLGLLNRWTRIGLHPGRFDEAGLGDPARRGMERAIRDAEHAIAAAQFGIATTVNGWNYSMKIGQTGPDWALNAAIARGGYGNRPEDSVYYQRDLDAGGQPLSGSERYTMTFSPDALPPVGAFWSITAYSKADFDLFENPARRYAIGDRTAGLVRNADGSLTIALQRQRPADPLHRANWLPVGEGPFYLVIRTYDPQKAILTGQWAPPEVLRIADGGQ